tara:strand:+ start:2105 stop:3322 length:1218 start_codon:yes stop_codon:yes gene_type:complete
VIKKKIIYKNHIKKKILKFKNNKIINNKCKKYLNKIINNLNVANNVFHSLSKNFILNFKEKDLKKFDKFKTVVIIGMGGSVLGSESIYHFLKKKIKKKFLFFDNINSENLQIFKSKSNLKKILFIIISKSGNTIETLSNLLSLGILKKRAKNLIIISEKNENLLYLYSQKLNLFHIEHKTYIGGRFSVLSEVGMLPAYLMGLNINNIKKNLLNCLKSKNQNFLRESSIKMSYLLNKKIYKNIIFLNYVPKLNKFLYWNQQLIAESLGKKNKGFLPSISEAPKDHHSLLQLYLDGPKDKLFYIFSAETNDDEKIKMKKLDKKLNFLNNKSLDNIKIAQKNSFIQVLTKKNIPYREFKISKYDEETLGELFSYFMLETALIGHLSNINPFNQPAVEEVKVMTEKLLN